MPCRFAFHRFQTRLFLLVLLLEFGLRLLDLPERLENFLLDPLLSLFEPLNANLALLYLPLLFFDRLLCLLPLPVCTPGAAFSSRPCVCQFP